MIRRTAIVAASARVLGTVLSAFAAACNAYDVCDEPPSERLALAAERLSQTGLYSDIASRALAPGVHAFEPQYTLFSDGATKRRFVYLPQDARIDTRDMDDWRFPIGTKLWKEFRSGDRPIETRLLHKVGEADDAWLAISYLWMTDASDALAVPEGAEDALGTTLDVPAASQCMACHGGRRSFVLGFSALQLSREAPGDALDLARLVAGDRLSNVPESDIAVPGTRTEREVLGYLHANCGHCHNQARPQRSGARCFDPENELDFWLTTRDLARPGTTPTYRTAVGSVVVKGNPGASRLLKLVSRRGTALHMPPLGTERVDERAVRMFTQWIEELPATTATRGGEP